ncbi:hypothetical protein BP5796_00278 [Coleophoma crateriformis]|uniref:Myb-like domain-containing protein n=1 Tax=Coleophoma crateriformis TaxID=565419 RepID=A0A3D8T7K7_9HELO|nr:hypothetical protein BP5796_00278 [Coleophoma crateriformis]
MSGSQFEKSILSRDRGDGTWSPEDDKKLMAARADGLSWDILASRFFPQRSSNACRKRHTRLLRAKATNEDWDKSKWEKLAKAYMGMRKEIWSGLAKETGEGWETIEQKCMSEKIPLFRMHARDSTREARKIDDESPIVVEEQIPAPTYSDDGSISPREVPCKSHVPITKMQKETNPRSTEASMAILAGGNKSRANQTEETANPWDIHDSGTETFENLDSRRDEFRIDEASDEVHLHRKQTEGLIHTSATHSDDYEIENAKMSNSTDNQPEKIDARAKLRQLPILRPIQLRNGRTLNLDEAVNIEAALGYQVGEVRAMKCGSCATGSGIFLECVTVSDCFGGCCVGCYFNGQGPHCSFLSLPYHLQTVNGFVGTHASVDSEQDDYKAETFHKYDSEANLKECSNVRLPVNILTIGEYEALRESIRTQYVENKSNSDQEPLLAEKQKQWIDILEAAACHDQRIQGMLLDERLQPGKHWREDLSFNPSWLLGFWLPDSHGTQSLDPLEQNLTIINALTPQILRNVKKRLDTIIDEVLEDLGMDVDNVRKNTGLPVNIPTEDMMGLLKIIQRESGRSRRTKCQELALEKLGTMPDLENCRVLKDHMESDNASDVFEDVHGYHQRFANEAIQMLQYWRRSWMIPKPLPSLDITDFHTNTVQDFVGSSRPGIRLRNEIDTRAEMESTSALKQVDTFTAYHGTVPSLLSSLVFRDIPHPKTFDSWEWPTTGALLSPWPSAYRAKVTIDPLARQNVAVDEERLSASLLSREQSFEAGRRNSHEEFETKGDDQAICDRVLQHMKQVLTTTDKERGAYFDKICVRMCDLVSRPANLDTEHEVFLASFTGCRSYNSLDLILDNWWHCRRLLQMLKLRYSLSDNDYHESEINLIMVLAMIEGGSDDPFPWLFVLDGLLASIGRLVMSTGTTERESVDRNRLIEELILFAHGTAISTVQDL